MSLNVFAIVGEYFQRLKTQEALPNPQVLHYESSKNDLRVWIWPMYKNGVRVKERELTTYAVTHDIKLPCCFCGRLRGTPMVYFETKLLVGYDGEHFIGCGTGHCGYYVKTARIFQNEESPNMAYPRRVDAQSTTTGLPKVIGNYANPVNKPAGTLSLLMRLDDGLMGGLPGHVVDSLLTRCRVCDWACSTKTFHEHVCLLAQGPFSSLRPVHTNGDAAELSTPAE